MHSKCAFACPLNHLKSLHTFVLADFEQQFIPALVIVPTVRRQAIKTHQQKLFF